MHCTLITSNTLSISICYSMTLSLRTRCMQVYRDRNTEFKTQRLLGWVLHQCLLKQMNVDSTPKANV